MLQIRRLHQGLSCCLMAVFRASLALSRFAAQRRTFISCCFPTKLPIGWLSIKTVEQFDLFMDHIKPQLSTL